ncbi:uncharacterized protein [Haliotis asinina]
MQIIAVVLAVSLLVITTGSEVNLVFSGGSISSQYVKRVNQTFMKMHMVVLSGWKLGYGPCGTGCDFNEINYNNTIRRHKMLDGANSTYLGQWFDKIGYSNMFYSHDITDYMNNNSVSYVMSVSKQDDWELEVTEFDYDVDMAADYTDISFVGPAWRPYLEDRKIVSPKSEVQIKLQPHIRNDTGIPNNTPRAMFKPVYRLPLNQVSVIDLAAVDIDGDAVYCEAAAFVTAGGISPTPNVTIHKNCRIEITAFESLGFTNNGSSALAITVADYNRNTISVGGSTLKPYFKYLSQISIQFMIVTVNIWNGPAFVDPTPANQHRFIIDAYNPLTISLAAQGYRAVNQFYLTSFPVANLSLASGTGGTRQVVWHPTQDDIGSYMLMVRASDINGHESAERSFVIQVRERESFTHLTHPTESKLFAYVPTNTTYQCQYGDTCIRSIPVMTSFQVSSVRMKNAFQLLEWTGPFTSAPGTLQYYAAIKLDSMEPGEYTMCLSLEATGSSFNKTICVTGSINEKDPCESLPCQNYGQCVSTMGNFTCLCLPTYTGTVCEKVLDLCSPSPCVHGKCFKVFSGVPSFYCLCQPGWKGRTCDSGLRQINGRTV